MKQLINHFVALTCITCLGLQGYAQNTESIWVTIPDSEDIPAHVGDHWVSTNEQINTFLNSHNIIHVEQALTNSRNEDLLKVYEFECECTVEEMQRDMKRINSLENPEPAPVYEMLYEPNDYLTNYDHDYALDLINAKGAWDFTHGDPNVILGVSDGNFYINHEDLSGEIIYYTGWVTPSNYYNHGTAVAQIVAGKTDNEEGKSSIGFDCKIYATMMNYNYVLQASYSGVKVINMSWTSGCYANSYVQQIVDEVYNNGTILVAAAGNGGTCGGASNLVYPSACDNVISVTSIGPNDNHERIIGVPTSTHQHNHTVDIAAPGYDVALTVAPTWYITGNGTSFAAPYVTGTIGLMLSVNPCLTFEDVQEILQTTADDIYPKNPFQYLNLLGAGRLNAKEAVMKAQEYTCGSGAPAQSNNLPDAVFHDDPFDSQNTNDIATAYAEYTVQMYPNPTNESITLNWGELENIRVIVTDVTGAIVHDIKPSTGNSTIFSFEARGVYFVKIEKNNRVIWTDKLVRI